MRFTLAVAQMKADKGSVGANLDRIAASVAAATAQGAEVVLFPEAASTGYFLEGGVAERAMDPDELARELQARLGGGGATIEAFVGFYERQSGRPSNTVAHLLVDNGAVRCQGVYRKLFPPSYGVFDEGRFHAQGSRLGVFETRVGRVGVLVCEDMWHSIPRTLLALSGCHTVLIPAATPARGFASATPSNIERYERMLRGNSEEHGVFSALCCLTGSEGNRMLAGGSMVTDPFGRVIAQAPTLGEHLLLVPIDLEDVERAQRQTPLLQDMRNQWPDMKRLVEELTFPDQP